MVAAAFPRVSKHFWTDAFVPPAGYSPSSARNSEVSIAEILAGGIREDDWSFPVVLTTAAEDRVGDVVVPQGGDFSHFAKSPSIFFDHQEITFPVGSMRSPRDGRLYLAVVPDKDVVGRIWIFKPRETEEGEHFAVCRTVWALVRAGLLNGVSVGFDPVGPVKNLHPGPCSPDGCSGGHLYRQWELLEVSLVGVPANRDSLVIRDCAPLPEAIAKRLHPTVCKSLARWYPREFSSMTLLASIPKEHDDTRDIKFEDGKWHVLDNDTRKTLDSFDTREEALHYLRGIEYGKHAGKSALAAIRKGLSESSAVNGGYATGADAREEETKRICKAIAQRMEDHKDEAQGHEVYFDPKSKELRHVHARDAKPEQIKAIGEDLSDLTQGGRVVSTSENNPKLVDEGFVKAYPASVACKKSAAGKRQKRLALHVARGRHLIAMQGKGLLPARVRKSLLGKVHARLQQIDRDHPDVPESQRIPLAFSLCGQAKGLLPPLVKSHAGAVRKGADEGDDEEIEPDDDFDDDYGSDTDDPALADNQPPGLALAQRLIDDIQAELPMQEPETREFWESIIQQIQDHGEERYPEEDFGGADTAGAAAAGGDQGLTTTQEAQANSADQDALTRDALYRYKRRTPGVVRRIVAARRLKSLRLPFGDDHAETIKKAANHCHEIGDMGAEETAQGMRLKGYTPAHHRKMRVVARSLDRLHGMLCKEAETAGQVGDAPQTAEGRRGEMDLELKGLTPEVLKGLEKRLEESEAVYKQLALRAGLGGVKTLPLSTANSVRP